MRIMRKIKPNMKPVTLVLTEDLLSDIEAYQDREKLNTRTAAIVNLLKSGLRDWDDKQAVTSAGMQKRFGGA